MSRQYLMDEVKLMYELAARPRVPLKKRLRHFFAPRTKTIMSKTPQ
jgi:hypothetical protein